MEEPLLLHSLLEHRDLIFGCLDAAAPRRVIEIGSETGGFTKALVEWADERGAEVASIEPMPTLELIQLSEANPRFSLIAGRSPEALRESALADAYIVDGDHNYWTVSRELEAIFGDSARTTLAILHDVGWPCARRDQYYAPEALPPEALHPHDHYRGRVPDRPELVDGGFRGDGQFAVALTEGGERNGVLTAVEDFVGGRSDLVLNVVAPVFGVGFVYPKSAPYAEKLGRLLGPWDRNAFLARLERNRVRLFAEVLRLQDLVRAQPLRRDRLVLDYEDRLSSARAEIDALRLERARLRAQVEGANGGAATAGEGRSGR